VVTALTARTQFGQIVRRAAAKGERFVSAAKMPVPSALLDTNSEICALKAQSGRRDGRLLLGIF
jgi:hypothetical protein